MQVFTRQMRLLGADEAIGWAMEVTAKVQQVTGKPVSLWVGAIGLPPGAVAWSVPVEGMAELAAATETMQADAALTDLTRRGREYVVEVMPDRLHQLIHGEITGPAEVGSYMGSVTAVAAEGRGADAGAWAVKIADMWAGITGLSPVVTTTVAGPMFEYSWFVRHETAQSIDDATAKIMASDEYVAELDAAGGLFHPGAAQVYARRIA